MDPDNQSRHPIIRTAASLGLIFGLLHLANSSDILSDLTRPLVVGLLQFLGHTASDQEGYLIVGALQIPWTRDCAGLNVLTILWAVTLWVNRGERLNFLYWFRLALAVPVSFAANVGRILTLIGYRHLFFPGVESPQLHYFIGFLWLVPFLGLFTGRKGRHFGGYLLETLYFAAVLSLLAPYVASPGGTFVTLATLIYLANSRHQESSARFETGLMIAWLAASGLIAVAGMESLWIPWMLLCPRFVSRPLLASLSGIILLLGTLPLLAMQSPMQWALGIAGAILGLRLLNQHSQSTETPAFRSADLPPRAGWRRVGLMSALVIPFLASTFLGTRHERQAPPPGVMARELDVNSYHVRLVGQAPDVDLTWYGPYGEGRHHTLPVCMRYRGVFLRASETEDSVMTDGQHWFREFFLLEDQLILTYPEYLKGTFSPFSPPGIHLIASTPVDSMLPAAFAQAAENLASRLNRFGRATGTSSIQAP